MTEPLKVIYYDQITGKFVFDEESYAEMLLSDEGIRDLPVAIVSIVGDARKGKSFLMNFILRYLERYGQDDWMGHEDEPLKGFPWRDGIETETTGIVLWPKPFVLTRSDGSKIVILLIDTQGFFDDNTPHHVIEQFFSISTIISSIQIYNQMNNIQSNHLTTLSKFSKYSEQVVNLTGHKAFQKLLILIRDWNNQREFPHGFRGGKNFLRYKRIKQKDSFNVEWNKLYESFSEIECFLMPTIGDSSDGPEFNGEIGKLKPEFVKSLNELIPVLLSPDKIVTKFWENEEMPFWKVMNYFKELTDHLMEYKMIKIEHLDPIIKRNKIDSAFRTARMVYLATLSSPIDKSESGKVRAFDDAEEAALEYFQNETQSILNMDESIDEYQLKLITFFANYKEKCIKYPEWVIKGIEATKVAYYKIGKSVGLGATFATGIATGYVAAVMFL